MSGHSKWAKIKRQKGITDQKRGAIFTKLGRNITMAAKEGGPDPDSNFSLRLAIDKAKQVNMPLENIERALKKAVGGEGKNNLVRVSYEAIAHNGVVMVIDCQTDNTNRTVSEIKKTLENNGAKIASIGSVAWKFSELGFIEVKPAKLKKSQKFGEEDTYAPVDFEQTEMDLMEVSGISDINEGESQDEEGNLFKVLNIYTDKNSFSKVVKEIEAKQLQIINYEIIKKAKDIVEIPDDYHEKIDNLVEVLEEVEDVDFVWLNI
jgi:YebC/PmpR family DNA-binding regulatory protein